MATPVMKDTTQPEAQAAYSMRASHPLPLWAAAFAALLAACGAGDPPLAMTPLDELPAEMRAAPAPVREAYQFAAANPEILQSIPCYCGCGAMGHTSNYACYVSDVGPGGDIIYDSHALGCSICVDITQDTMRLLRQGLGVEEIRAAIDDTYSPFGPSNMP
jgi:hypothetical protein